MSVPPKDGRGAVAVLPGPTMGGQPSVVIAGAIDDKDRREQLKLALEEVQIVEKVCPGPPRRGKTRSRQGVLVTVICAKRAELDEALKSIKKAINAFFRWLKSESERLRERREISSYSTRRRDKRRTAAAMANTRAQREGPKVLYGTKLIAV